MMLTLDGASGEGGGQILRSALALSMATGRAFRIVNLRARRDRPGLRPQHQAAVRAAAHACGAAVEGAEIGTQSLVFRPGRLRAGHLALDVGTAGSAVLVAQTLLPALLTGPDDSTLTLGGGTHNPLAPPFEFLEQAYLPVLEALGPRLEARLLRRGFHPQGGGRIELAVHPASRLARLDLEHRGPVMRRRATAVVAGLPRDIAERELRVVIEDLGLDPGETRVEVDTTAPGHGNYLVLTLAAEAVTEVITAFGRRGLPAERVARDAVAQARGYLDADVPVGPYLADQLVTPLALAGGGSFVTLTPTAHTETQLALVERFIALRTAVVSLEGRRHRIRVGV